MATIFAGFTSHGLECGYHRGEGCGREGTGCREFHVEAEFPAGVDVRESLGRARKAARAAAEQEMARGAG